MTIRRLTSVLFVLCLLGLNVRVYGDSTSVWPRRGDINADSSFDIHDLVAELGWMRADSGAPACADLNADSRVDVFDLLCLVRQITWLRESWDEEFRAKAGIGGHTLNEPYAFLFGPIRENWPTLKYPRRDFGEMRDEYGICANRELQRVEFVLGEDTLYETSGITPVLTYIDSIAQADSFTPYPYMGYFISEPTVWQLNAWDYQGNCFSDSGEVRFVIPRHVCIDCGGSPNKGQELEFPLVLEGPWQRFALVPPVCQDTLLPLDLNPEGEETVVFENIDQLVEAIMQQIVENIGIWGEGRWRLYGSYGPFVSSAISVHTGAKTNRLLFEIEDLGTGGFMRLAPLDGNERLLSKLGFPFWLRAFWWGRANNNYRLDQDIFERYKDRNKK